MENNTINDGGPVIGSIHPAVFRSDGSCSQMDHMGGLTIRDYFAGMALQGIISNPSFTIGFCDPIADAKNAYVMADAMIIARDGNGGIP